MKILQLPFFLISLILTLGACSKKDNSLEGKNILQFTSNDYPIAFVANVPVVSMKGQLSAFGNHGTSILDSVPGGDLYIHYPSGKLKNVTLEAGFGIPSGDIQEGNKAIAVRQPTVHWSGNKIIFSMLVGGPRERFDRAEERRWQIYEATNLGEDENPIITKVPHQDSRYNNISPIYGASDDIIFISDSPLYSMEHTYPQLDEYESIPSSTGIWKIDLQEKKLSMIEHAPSGVFDLFLDSFGRILYTKWDHLKRDQQADADRFENGLYRAFDYPSELDGATPTKFPEFDIEGNLIADSNGVLYELFPEARHPKDPTKKKHESVNNFNQFFIWQINEDGSGEETINHLGRHEFGGSYMPPVFLNDPNLSEMLPKISSNKIIRDSIAGNAGVFQLKEDANRPGTYIGTYALEFDRESSGRILEFYLPPGKNPETITVKDYTNSTLDDYIDSSNMRLPSMTGHYRNPLILNNKKILVSHTSEYRVNRDDSKIKGLTQPRFIFRLKELIPNPQDSDMIAGPPLTLGIYKHVRWWSDAEKPDEYMGMLSETDAVEMRARPRPLKQTKETDPIEKEVLLEEGVLESELQNWMIKNNLALIVSRNVTLRDKSDVTQPFNLRIPNGVENRPTQGKVYDISQLQILQGELTRAYKKQAGRRVYSRGIRNNQHHPDIEKFYSKNGKVELSSDGSMAAFVPAGRALSWQLTSPNGEPVVRERVWVSFSAGEIRTCTSCHGLNSSTQNGITDPKNKPEALRKLIKKWKILK